MSTSSHHNGQGRLLRRRRQRRTEPSIALPIQGRSASRPWFDGVQTYVPAWRIAPMMTTTLFLALSLASYSTPARQSICSSPERSSHRLARQAARARQVRGLPRLEPAALGPDPVEPAPDPLVQRAPPAPAVDWPTRRAPGRPALEAPSPRRRVRSTPAPTILAQEPQTLPERTERRHPEPEHPARGAILRRRRAAPAREARRRVAHLRLHDGGVPIKADIPRMIRAPAREPRTRPAHRGATLPLSYMATERRPI